MASPENSAAPRRLLLVDDEPLVLDVMSTFLRREGFEVLCAADADQALLAFEHEPASFAAAILDRNLPRMDGPTLAARLRQLRPELPLVFATGLSSLDDTTSRLVGPPPKLIRKPFRGAQLVEVVRAALA